MIDVTTATLDELKAEAHRLAPLVAEYQDAHKAVHREIDRRIRSATARTRLAALSPEDRAAFKDALDRDGK